MAIPRAAILFTMVVSLCVSSAFAQQDQRTRVVTVDEGITLRVPPAWRLTPLKGPVKLELTRAEGGAIAMAVYVTVERRRGASDAVQRVAEIAGPPAPEDRLFVMQGWPAVEATRLITARERGRAELAAGEGARLIVGALLGRGTERHHQRGSERAGKVASRLSSVAWHSEASVP